jgi:hypothetical protein
VPFYRKGGGLLVPYRRGLHRLYLPGESDPDPDPPEQPSEWPNADNTGWLAAGATLTAWDGPTFLAANQVIDSRILTGHIIVASHVKITRCQINGRIDCDGPNYSLILEDCNVDGGTAQAPAVGYGNLTIRRCNMVGGANTVIGGDNVIIEDSWLHDQYLGPTADDHENGFLSNGGSNITLRHNVIHADEPDNGHDGGVSTNCSLFGDFAPITDVLIENCYFPATPGAYSVSLGYNPSKPFGANPTNVVFRNNVFEYGPTGNGGFFGPVTSFLDANGNVFEGNTWEDGAPLTL